MGALVKAVVVAIFSFVFGFSLLYFLRLIEQSPNSEWVIGPLQGAVTVVVTLVGIIVISLYLQWARERGFKGKGL